VDDKGRMKREEKGGWQGANLPAPSAASLISQVLLTVAGRSDVAALNVIGTKGGREMAGKKDAGSKWEGELMDTVRRFLDEDGWPVNWQDQSDLLTGFRNDCADFDLLISCREKPGVLSFTLLQVAKIPRNCRHYEQLLEYLSEQNSVLLMGSWGVHPKRNVVTFSVSVPVCSVLTKELFARCLSAVCCIAGGMYPKLMAIIWGGSDKKSGNPLRLSLN